MAKGHDDLVRALGAMSEGIIRDMPDHPTARALQAEVNRLRQGVAALNNVNTNRSPLDTEAAHALKVAKMARKLETEIGSILNRSAQHWTAGLVDAQDRIEKKINLAPDAFASEIRAAFRGLNAKAQGKLIEQLVNENRGPELAAIIKAPIVLTGITEEQRATYEQAIVATHAAGELDEQACLESAWQVTTAATKAANAFVKELTNPSRIAEIERGDDAATAAGAAFDQSLQ